MQSKPDHTVYRDPRTSPNQRGRRQLKGPRGAPKPGRKFTKKEAVTLLPSNGKTHFFDLKFPVGLLFNLDACDLKQEKYIWKWNVRSNDRPWVGE